MLHITLVTDHGRWYVPFAEQLADELAERGHQVQLVFLPDEIPERGDVTFLLSLTQLVSPDQLARSRNTIVVHPSALPEGKGWSPLTWQVVEGKRDIPFSLFEAVDRVDAGPIYLRGTMRTDGTELVDDLRRMQAETTRELCLQFIDAYPAVLSAAEEQDPTRESFYPRRTPEDARIDPTRSVIELFDLLRTCDPNDYPAFFEHLNQTYELRLSRRP